MGIFPYKTKKGVAVLLETWTPEQKTQKLDTTNYPTYNLTQHMTFEQAKVVAKDYNTGEAFKKQQNTLITIQAQTNSYLNDKSLPQHLVEEFEKELAKEYKGNPDRLETILQHWNASKLMLNKIKLDYTEFHDKRFAIYDYYEKDYHTVKTKKSLKTFTV